MWDRDVAHRLHLFVESEKVLSATVDEVSFEMKQGVAHVADGAVWGFQYIGADEEGFVSTPPPARYGSRPSASPPAPTTSWDASHPTRCTRARGSQVRRSCGARGRSESVMWRAVGGRRFLGASVPQDAERQTEKPAAWRKRRCDPSSTAGSETLLEDRKLFGQLLEIFVFQELNRAVGWREDAPRFFHPGS